MFEGAIGYLRVLYPTTSEVIASADGVIISDESVEFSDASFYDQEGDLYTVVPVSFDLRGNEITFKTLIDGQFLNAPSIGGFNGYELGVSDAPDPGYDFRIIYADIIWSGTTLDITSDRIMFGTESLLIDMSGLTFERYDSLMLSLGFEIAGTYSGDLLIADNGRDQVFGYNGNDTLIGLGGDDKLYGGSGNDFLVSGSGKDTLLGESGNDNLTGGTGRDLLRGGVGNDKLVGGAGNDSLSGGSGADVFVFNRGDGTDVITDFASGVDRIQIGTGAERFADLTVRDSGVNAIITFADVKITLLNVDHRLIDADDFLFA